MVFVYLKKIQSFGFRGDVKRHVLTFSTSGQRQVTTFCTCAMTSRKKSHVSGCRRQAGDVCCLRCLISVSSSLNLLMTAFLTIFRRFPTTFRRFPKIFHYCSEGQTNVPEHFPRISEVVRRFPKTFEEDPKMFR